MSTVFWTPPVAPVRFQPLEENTRSTSSSKSCQVRRPHQPGNRGNHLRFCLQCGFDLGCDLVPKLSEQVIFCINPANRTAKSLNFQEAA